MNKEELTYDLAKFAIEQLPYNDFEVNGFTDLNSENNFTPLTNEDWLELLYDNFYISSTEINKETNEFIINKKNQNAIWYKMKWDKDCKRYCIPNNVHIDEILYYTQLVYKF